jgi:hypothetical protein
LWAWPVIVIFPIFLKMILVDHSGGPFGPRNVVLLIHLRPQVIA